MRKLRNIRHVLTILLLFACSIAADSLVSDASKESIDSRQQAIERAKSVTGINLKQSPGLAVSEERVSSVLYSDSSLIGTTVISGGGAVWRVEMEGLLFNLNSPNPEFPKNATVYIDSATGAFLKAELVRSDCKNASAMSVDSSSVRAQMTMFKEAFLGVPDQAPALSLIQALGQDRFYPLEARKVEAWYVVYSLDTLDARPAWVICMLGMPPIGRISPPFRTDKRIVVDATTGRGLLGFFYGGQDSTIVTKDSSDE
ncbi:MAG TPA: hypothetical protein PLF13_04890 [candidate division Zixibacteria bacterium]|nr:hypothetical protein [candidate division Zixibacteria bacterium]